MRMLAVCLQLLYKELIAAGKQGDLVAACSQPCGSKCAGCTFALLQRSVVCMYCWMQVLYKELIADGKQDDLVEVSQAGASCYC
jgi:hypothetical protein